MGLFVCLGLALVSMAGVAWAQPAPSSSPSVAVFYDGEDRPLAEGYLDSHHIDNLLGHFGLRAEIIPIARYQPGSLGRYRAAFFVGSVSGTVFPAGFLAEVRASDRPFCWIGRHIGELVNSADGRRRFGFRYVDYRDDLEFREVIYKNVTLAKDDPDLNIVTVDDGGAQVLATAVNDERVVHPYALRRGRFWYFADTPFSYTQEGGRYLVFCDLLHDILEMDHAPSARALARIEDVSAEIDPGDLRRVADLLGARRVPFQIAVIPVFRNPAKGIEIYLSDRPALVEAIQYMMARGGVAILHGVTHQYRGASGDDYEFWDEAGNRPVARDLAELVLRRLQLGLSECFANGIIPLAFETPHYAASETDYRTLGQIFTMFNERTMATPHIGSIQYFPYPVVDRYERYVVPENLGYLPLENPDPRQIVEGARKMRVVRDAVASFYFHPFLEVGLLGDVVKGIAAEGFKFVSLREFGGAVNYQDRFVVRTASGAARVVPQNEFWRLRRYDASGKQVSERISSERQTGPVEIALDVPAGGWAALDALRELPRRSPVAGPWMARLARWWSERRAVPPELSPPRKAWILWVEGAAGSDGHNQQSYRSALETFGYEAQIVRAERFAEAPRSRETVLVVPEAAGTRLSERQQQRVIDYLAGGGAVVADGRQAWLARLGFRWTGRRIPVRTVVDVLFPETPLGWRPEEMVERFEAPSGVEQLAVDHDSRQALAVAGRHGAGRYLYLAAPLDPHTPDATSHYPYLAEYLAETFRTRLPARSARLEVYFDPGYREGANLDRLAAFWRQSGVRAVYAAAWHFYPQYSFDYAGFVRACHRNGLAVYAWLIFPAVTPQMWEQHPEWRERSAGSADGRAGWRYAMNLEDPACLRAALGWMKDLLRAHDWDGVNFTELNYDADFKDYLRPDKFVPMNDAVRAAFRGQAGFDPAELFEPASRYYHRRNPQALEQFLQYREDAVVRWHRRVLEEVEPLRRERGWEVILTMLDSLHSKYVRPALGVNSLRVVELMKEFDFTLQVEDPAEHWASSPDRYRRFAATYRKLVPDARRLMFDINVMPNRSVAGTFLPTSTATGTELARTVEAAAEASGRVAIYSEYTVRNQDWALLGTVLARGAKIESAGGDWKLDSPLPVLVTGTEGDEYYLDGRLWPAISPEGLLAPAGRRRITTERPWFRGLERERLPARLLHLSGDLLDARAEPTGLVVRYASPGRAVALLSQKPLEIRVDGQPAAVAVEPAGRGAWTAILPRGEHQVEVTTMTQAGIVVNMWSWASASTITIFGGVTTMLMIGIYVHLRMRRPARRGGTL